MDIIQRHQWGAQYPDGFQNAPLPAREVWLHHSVTPAPHGGWEDDADAVRSLERIGQQRFGGGISYTFVVPPSGRIFEGHSVHRQGAHTGGRNDISRAICLVGNYETDHPTDAQLDAVAALLRHGAAQGWWTAPRLTGGHRDAPGASTACPGRHAVARIDDINRLAASGGGAAIGGDDMPYTLAEIHDAVWHGTPGAKLINIREPGKPSGWAEYALGALPHWVISQQLRPMRRQLDALTKLVAEQGGVSAEEIAAALREGLVAEVLPVLREVVGEALGEDQAERADEISERVLDGLADRLQGGEQE